MFSSAPNPYDEIIGKATDENLASEDWDLNMQVCDKVMDEGQNGARNAIASLQKRLAHRNPNVQIYALELANTLAQNCSKPLLEELSSRNWTTGLDRLVNDRATAEPVKKKALGFVKAWAKQFEELNDPNLGMMGQLYDQLRAKNFSFDEPERAPETSEELRRRQEEEELARVLELSKQDKGGRYNPPAPTTNGRSSSQPAYPPAVQARQSSQPTPASQPPPPEPEQEQIVDMNTATRVRALYTFTTAEVGELNFERGDVIKVLDRGFKEWWRGACNGKIGIFPTTYVEALPEPTPRELQEEAQEEARVFASLGLVDQLLQTMKSLDPARGDRLDDRPEIEEMYQASVGLQGQINALIKKYSDQKAELEHMNANFIRAMRQYEELSQPPPPGPAYGYVPPVDQYAAQYPVQQSQPQPQSYAPQQFPQAVPAQPPAQPYPAQQQQQQPPQPYYPEPHPAQAQQVHPAQSQSTLQRVPTGAPSFPPQSPPRKSTEPGAAGLGAGADPEADHRAAWDAYYRQQAEVQQGLQGGQTAYPGQTLAPGQGVGVGGAEQGGMYGNGPIYPAGGVDQVSAGMGRMSVHGQ